MEHASADAKPRTATNPVPESVATQPGDNWPHRPQFTGRSSPTARASCQCGRRSSDAAGPRRLANESGRWQCALLSARWCGEPVGLRRFDLTRGVLR